MMLSTHSVFVAILLCFIHDTEKQCWSFHCPSFFRCVNSSVISPSGVSFFLVQSYTFVAFWDNINACAADGGRARSWSWNLVRILSELRSEVRSNVAHWKWDEVSFVCVFLSDVMSLMNDKQIVLIAVIYWHPAECKQCGQLKLWRLNLNVTFKLKRHV